MDLTPHIKTRRSIIGRLLVGLVISVVPAAHAGVIYSGALDVSFAALPPGTGIDYDFAVNGNAVLAIGASYTYGPPPYAAISALSLVPWVERVGSDSLPSALSPGTPIDNLDTYSSSVSGNVGTLIGVGGAPPVIGNFSATGGAEYLGFEFFVGADLHYAYADVETSATDSPFSSFTVKDWAYESDPRVGIVAGAGETPEPSSLAMVSIAIVGLATLQRRRYTNVRR